MSTTTPEFIAGTPVVITMTFANDAVTPAVLTDPSAANLAMRVGANADVLIPLASFTHVSTGVYTYTYDTTGVATSVAVPVTLQVQTTGTLKSISSPTNFNVLPPSFTELT